MQVENEQETRILGAMRAVATREAKRGRADWPTKSISGRVAVHDDPFQQATAYEATAKELGAALGCEDDSTFEILHFEHNPEADVLLTVKVPPVIRHLLDEANELRKEVVRLQAALNEICAEEHLSGKGRHPVHVAGLALGMLAEDPPIISSTPVI